MLQLGVTEIDEEEESTLNKDYHYHINFKYKNDTLLLWEPG
jgi:hypothetical protein